MTNRSQPWGQTTLFPDPQIERAWTVRKSATFAIVSSSGLWLAILWLARGLVQP